MGKSLTDHEDPEKRIADLEAGSRCFEALAAPPSTNQMMKYTYVYMFAGIAVLGAIYMALFMIGAVLGSEMVWQVGGPIVFVGFLLSAMPLYGLFQRRLNREKKVLLYLGSDGLTITTRPGE